jgi:hypothetical protein
MSRRKVHFSVPLHQIEYLDQQWETASRLARDGSSWLRMGIDRQRFRDRIERAAEVLNRVLDFEFRQKIYRERFENLRSTDEAEIPKKLVNRKKSTQSISIKQNCQLVIENKLDESTHKNSPVFHQNLQKQRQQQQEIKYTNRKNKRKKKKNRRKRRDRVRARRRKRKN